MDYAYDGRGNRSQMTVTGTDRYTVQYTYDANNRLLQEEKTRGVQTGLTTYTYDPNGNLTQRMELGCDGSPSAASFTYDVFGQQATATYNGATTAYTYNAQGIRVAKTTAGSRTDFLLDGSSAAAAGAATVGSALIVPEYVNNAGSFISWIKQNFESTKTVMSLDQVKQLFELARSYGVEISADLAGHPGSAWEMAHIHFGKNRIHIAVAEEAIEWILEQLN